MLDRCDQEGCAGHLGKFPDCLTEALHAVSDGTDLTTGTVDWVAHYTLMIFDQDETTVDVGPPFTIPKGAYILAENDQGFVWIYAQGPDVAMIREQFEHIDALFGVWLDTDDDPAGDSQAGANAADGHEWQTAPLTGTMTCSRCKLLPLDEDDVSSPCTPS